MKQFLFLLYFLIIHSCSVAQEKNEIVNLFGIIDSTGKYYLIYEDLRIVFWTADGKRINFIDTQNNLDSLIFEEDSWWMHGQYGIQYITDYDFFSNNPLSLITVGKAGMIGSKVNNIELNKSVEVWAGNSAQIIVNKDKPNKIYLTAESWRGENGYTTSIDSGQTWPYELDTLGDKNLLLIPFNLLSLYPNSDSTMFGIDSLGNLIKSYDAGKSYDIVEASGNWNFLRENICYDTDLKHLYAVTYNSGNYFLYISDNYGNKDSWEVIFTSDSKISVSPDFLISGKINFSTKNKIYQSKDYGSRYSLVYQLNYNIVGIFTVPKSDTIYVGTPFSIREITQNSNKPIKQALAVESLSYYPLHIGDKWRYKVTGNYYDIERHPFEIDITRTVLKDTIMDNDKKYFQISETRSDNNFPKYIYERIDSIDLKVFRYDPNIIDINHDLLIYNFSTDIGDTTFSNSDNMNDLSNSIYLNDTLMQVFEPSNGGIIPFSRVYSWWSLGYDFRTFSPQLGLTRKSSAEDGYDDYWVLEAAYINGIKYGDTTMVGVNKDDYSTIPKKFSLSQNYPNPFNPTTTIKYSIPSTPSPLLRGVGGVLTTLKIYDILGREVATLVNREQKPGNYEIQFEASNLTSGIYFYRLQSGSFVESKKMILVK